MIKMLTVLRKKFLKIMVYGSVPFWRPVYEGKMTQNKAWFPQISIIQVMTLSNFPKQDVILA